MNGESEGRFSFAIDSPLRTPGFDMPTESGGGGRVDKFGAGPKLAHLRGGAVGVDVIRQMWAYAATWPTAKNEVRGAVFGAPTARTAAAREELMRPNEVGNYKVRTVVWRTSDDDPQLGDALREVGRS